MKRYRLKKDLPAFKAGTECYIEEAGHMVPCCGISYTIVHKDQLEKNPNILTDWFEEIKEPTRWEPIPGETYWSLDGTGYVNYYESSGGTYTTSRVSIGNCFKTKEETERAAEYLKALTVVRGDGTSNPARNSNNWHVNYDIATKCLYTSFSFNTARNGTFGLPYFATEEDAKRSIKQHRNEWLTIFGFEEEE